MEMKKWNVLGQTRAGLFAVKPIAAGDELTWNYQLDSFEGHAKMESKCGAANCSGWIGLKPKQEEAAPPVTKKRKKSKAKKDKEKAANTAEEPIAAQGDAAAQAAASADAASSSTAMDVAVEEGLEKQPDEADATATPAAPKEKRKPKYLRRAHDSDCDAEAEPDEMDGTSAVAQPLVGADIQLHNFGEPLPNVWAMKATGEWEAYEAKR